MARRKITKSLHPPKPKGPKDPKRVAMMLANRAVTVTLRMRHMVNGVAYGPGEVRIPANLADSLLNTEGHAAVVEEQFQGTKAVIIGPRRAGGVTTRRVPVETFDTEYEQGAPSQVISGANMSDSGGNKF